MLSAIKLVNWQKFKRLDLDLTQSVATLVGHTEAGKSSIIRAIRWVLLNEFDGPASSFIRWGARRCSVTLTIDGHRITRRRTASGENTYQLDDVAFRAFGAQVPQPVWDVVRACAATFQNQFDNHLWLADSPGAVARALNEIVDLEKLDVAASQIAAALRVANASHSEARERHALATRNAERLSAASAAEDAFSIIQRKAAKHSRILIGLTRLKTLVASGRELRDKVRTAAAPVEAFANVEQCTQQATTQQARRDCLRQLVKRLVSLQCAMTPLPDLPSFEIDTQRQHRLKSLLGVARESSQTCERANCDLTDAINELKQFKVCPLCQQPTTSLSHC